MDDKELKELVEELLKQGIISLFDIHDMIKERISTKKALEIRDMFGKYQAAIISDIPESEIIDICRENGIKWQHAYDLQNSYEDGATEDAAKDMQNYMHQYGGIVIDNKDIPKFYKAAYSRSIARNNEIAAILENNFVDFKTIEHRVLIRDEETGAEGYTEAVQKLYINKADYDRIINIPALEPYKEFIFATDDITRISDVKEPREASYEEMVSRFCSAALKRKGIDSIYDPQTNHIHIDGEYIPHEIREKFKGMGIMIETHADHREFLAVKEMIENGKEPVNEEDIDPNREYDDSDEQEPTEEEETNEEEPEEEIIEEVPEDEEEEIEEDKKKKIEEQKDQDDDDNEPVIEEREYEEEIYPEYEDDDRTSDEEPTEEDVFEEYYPEEEEIQEPEYDEEREETEPSETEDDRSKEQQSSQYEEERIQEEQRQEEYREQEEQKQEEIRSQETSEYEAEVRYQESASEEQQKYEEDQRNYSEKTNEERIEEIKREYEQRQYESASETVKNDSVSEEIECEYQHSGSEYDINSDSNSSDGSDRAEIERTDTFRSSNKNDDLVQIEPDHENNGKDTGNTSDNEVHRVRNDRFDNTADSSRNANDQHAGADTYGSTSQNQSGSSESVFQENKREKDRKEAFYSQAEASQIQDSFKREDRGEQFQHDSHSHPAANDQGTPVIRTDKVSVPSVSETTATSSAQTADEIRSTVYQETGYNRNYVKTKSASSESAYNSLNALNRFKNDAMRQTEYGMGKAQMSEVNQGGIAYFGGSWAKGKQKEAQDAISAGFAKGEYNEIAAVLKRHGFKGDLESKEGFENLYESAVKLLDKNDVKLEKFEINGYKPLYMKKVMGVEKKTVNAKFKQLFGTEDVELADKMNKQLRKIMDARNKGKLAEQAKRMAPMKKKFKQMVKKNNDDTYSGYETLMSVKKGTENAFRMAVKIRDARRTVKLKKQQNKLLRYNMKMAKENQAYQMTMQATRIPKKTLDPDDFLKQRDVSEAHVKRLEKLKEKRLKAEERRRKLQGKIDKTENKRMWKKKKKTFVGKKEYKVHKIQTKLDKLAASGKNDFKKRMLEKQLKKQQAKLAKRKSMKKALNTVATAVRNRIQRTAIYKAAAKVLAPLKNLFGLQHFIGHLIKEALISIAPYILLGLLVLVAIHLFLVVVLCMYGGLMSIIPSMSIKDEQLTDPYETPMGKTYEVLVDEEEQWVDSLRSITAKEHKLTDFEDLIPWEDEIAAYNRLKHDNLGFENNKVTADILGIGEEYRGKIPQVDGGQSIYFRNNNNPDTISNIKDIMTLCSVHYDDGFSDYEYEANNVFDDIKMNLANWKDNAAQAIEKAITNIKKYFLNLLLGDGWGGPENLDDANYDNEKNELAYGTYAKTLFNASHDMTSQIQSVTSLQTAHMIGEESWSEKHDDDQSKIRGEKKTADFEDWQDFTIEGIRTVCTEKWGCFTPDEKFYYNDDGILFNKDYQTCTTKDGKELSYYVHIEDENCAFISDDEKDGHNCWEVTVTDNPDYNDEDGDGVDDDDEDTPKTIKTYTHKCAGHKGSYCGGHIILKTVGIVHGIEGDLVGKGMSTDREFEKEEHLEDRVPKIDDISKIKLQYVHAEDNLFEIDGYIEHAYIPSTWIGWTTTNIDAAYARYHQDWNYLYGIDINGCSVIDNLKKTLSPKEIEDILNEVAKNERLDDKTRDKLKLALSHVGTAGYNQTYHGLLFEENDGDNYHDSDCSGFASNVWYDELDRQIRSCANLVAWGDAHGVKRHMCEGGYEPGDIIVNIGGVSEDGDILSNHAVVYVGTFNGQIWGVECTSSNNGGIFYMKRPNSWYLSSFYLDMTP